MNSPGPFEYIRRPPQRSTPAQRAEVIKLAREGKLHASKIARKVGVTRSSAEWILQAAGLAAGMIDGRTMQAKQGGVKLPGKQGQRAKA